MTNTEILNDYFIWEEKNSIEHQKNYENKNVSETSDTITNTKIDSTQIDWKSITDPKLRKKMRMKAYNENNKDKYKDWYESNKDKIRVQNKSYYQINKNKIKIHRKTYQNKTKLYQIDYSKINREKIIQRQKSYRVANKERLYKQTLEWKRKNKNNIQYKLSCRLRERLRDALNVKHKVGSAVKDLGCTIDELKIYLESKFQSGMNWDNYGLYGWHIDHIKPLSSFDLSDRKQFLEACHYTNLQPLWAKDNLAKGSTIP